MEFLHIEVIYISIFVIAVLLILLNRGDSFNRYFSKTMQKRLFKNHNGISHKSRISLFVISLLLVFVAVARPVMKKDDVKIKKNGHNIVIAIDLSKSMLAKDIYPNRLEAAKEKAKQLVTNKNNKYALIGFSSNAYVISPLTDDSSTLRFFLESIDTSNISSNGTSIESAIKITNKLIKSGKKILVILSDGGDKKEFSKEIKLAHDKNIFIYIINTATTKGAPIEYNGSFLNHKNGTIYISKKNNNIKNLSLKTDGSYVDYRVGSRDIEYILREIDRRFKKVYFDSVDIEDYEEYFYYPLLLGILFFFLATISLPIRGYKILILIFGLAHSYKLEASMFDFIHIEKAKKYYQESRYDKSNLEYKKLNPNNQINYNIATNYYKKGDYEKAIEYYNMVKTEDKSLDASLKYNIGNSYVKLNKIDNARESYIESLKIKDDNDTRYNLNLLNKQKKSENKKNQDDSQQKNNQNKQKENKQKENKQKENNQNKQKNSKNKESEDSKNTSKQEENNKPKASDDNSKQQQNQKEKNQKNSKNKESKSSKNISKQKKNNQPKNVKGYLNDLQEEQIFNKLETSKHNNIPYLMQQKGGQNDNHTPW